MKNVPALGALAVLAFGLSLFFTAIPLIAGFEDVVGEDETTAPAVPAPAQKTQAKPVPATTAPAPMAPAPVVPATVKQTQAKPAPVTTSPDPMAPTTVKQTQAKPVPAAPTPAPAKPAIVDIKTLKFSRTISGFGYKKRDANLPSVENNIKAAMTVLLPIIKKIKEHPDGNLYKIKIIGHADGAGPEDPRGDKPGNLTISRERAEGVLDYIVANYNLSRDMFEIVAKGSSELKNQSNPQAGANRRVVIVFAP